MNKDLPQSAYINSTDGNAEELDGAIKNAARYQEFSDGISIALRFSEQLIEAQKSGKIKMTDAEIDVVTKQRRNTMDQYKSRAFTVWTTEYQNDSIEWQSKSKCNCPVFMKQYICKHIVGIALRLKLCKPPASAKNVPLGQKPSRGRPAKAKKALLTQ